MVTPSNSGMPPAIVRNWPSYARAAVTSLIGNVAVGNVVVENVQSGRVPLQSPQVTTVACWGVVTLLLSVQAFRGWFQDPNTIE